jgi:hypothetical protein
VGQVEGGAAAAALARVGDGAAGGVVVVAEFFLAEAGAGAAASVGEDVAALVLLGCGWCGVLHGLVPYPRQKCAKSSKEKTCVRTSGAGPKGLKEKSPTVAGLLLFFYYLVKDSRLGITHRTGVCCCLVMG